jgi:GH35 family endo-1,4-beta-xylanase
LQTEARGVIEDGILIMKVPGSVPISADVKSAAIFLRAFVLLLVTSINAFAWTGSVQFFGAASNAGTDPNQTFHGNIPFAQYFNQFTEDSSMGITQLEPNGPTFSGGTLDGSVNNYNYAKSRGFPFRWNATLYEGDRMPQWFTSEGSAQSLTDWKSFLAGVAAAMPNIDQIEIYNEPIHTGAASNIFNALGGAGTTGWDWLIAAFKIVRTYFPNASLGVNEWGSELTSDSTHGQYIALLQALQTAGVLQWYGLEGYFGQGFPDTPTTAQLSSGIDDFASQVSAIPIYITELTVINSDAQAQLAEYQQVIPAVMNSTHVFGVSSWNPDYEGAGFGSDAMNWMIANVPLPFTGSGAPTPTPSPSPTVSPTVTPTPTPTPSPSPLPSATPSATPSPTPTVSPSGSSTPTPSPTLTPTPTPAQGSPTPTPESTPPRHHRHHFDFDDFLSLWDQFIQWLESR